MPKPLAFRLAAALLRALGRRRFQSLLERLYLWDIRLPPLRRALGRVLDRIQAHTGSPLPPERRRDCLRAMARLYAEQQTDLVNCDADIGPALETVALDLLPALRGLRDQGCGVILVTPHFGNTVLCLIGLAEAGVPVNILVINDAAYKWAERKNLRFLGLGESAAACLRLLKRNEVVVLYGDMDFFPGGRTAPFFGAPYYPPSGPAKLALASGSPILPVYAVSRGGRHHLGCDAPIPVDAGSLQESIESTLLRSMEAHIGGQPSHWFIFRDPWDLKASDRMNRRQLEAVRRYKGRE
jgi:lauroyl/myristoyl acyltransferase